MSLFPTYDFSALSPFPFILHISLCSSQISLLTGQAESWSSAVVGLLRAQSSHSPKAPIKSMRMPKMMVMITSADILDSVFTEQCFY